uniref:Uncharacterized protein n=1 Tax=Myoviridae sp. ctCo31 TaxID=2825053 RepID=A0A8S5UM68_9CAUD|nr:MAG TPA: hypothetical protein [Myoviridae sp. ctCo31]
MAKRYIVFCSHFLKIEPQIMLFSFLLVRHKLHQLTTHSFLVKLFQHLIQYHHQLAFVKAN